MDSLEKEDRDVRAVRMIQSLVLEIHKKTAVRATS